MFSTPWAASSGLCEARRAQGERLTAYRRHSKYTPSYEPLLEPDSNWLQVWHLQSASCDATKKNAARALGIEPRALLVSPAKRLRRALRMD